MYTAEDIKKLHDLKQVGAISDEEYSTAKAAYLSSNNSVTAVSNQPSSRVGHIPLPLLPEHIVGKWEYMDFPFTIHLLPQWGSTPYCEYSRYFIG